MDLIFGGPGQDTLTGSSESRLLGGLSRDLFVGLGVFVDFNDEDRLG